MQYIGEYHGLQLYCKGVMFCAPDLMIASASLDAIKRKIEKLFTRKGRRHRFKSRHD